MEGKIYTCPLELTQKILSKKWTVIILWLLRHGKVRTKDFKNQIKGSNEKMIINHLNYLIEEKLIEKKGIRCLSQKDRICSYREGKRFVTYFGTYAKLWKKILC
ncbi:HxlR family transcriptional regulator [Leptotrichia trevisanii]|uniref:HxlR family transcriptional regulator n=1 Tax=Leptotrichia trevisanii TaxID=109328 RepID=A0A510K305_9FUSO|nr:HxlR family transcriptional regulator [Leptotrichia trevisanii]